MTYELMSPVGLSSHLDRAHGVLNVGDMSYPERAAEHLAAHREGADHTHDYMEEEA